MTMILEMEQTFHLESINNINEKVLLTIVDSSTDIGDLCITAKSILTTTLNDTQWNIIINGCLTNHREIATVINNMDVNIHKQIITENCDDSNILYMKAIMYSWPNSYIIPIMPGEKLVSNLITLPNSFYITPLGETQKLLTFPREKLLKSNAIKELCLCSEYSMIEYVRKHYYYQENDTILIESDHPRKSLIPMINPYS